MNEERMKKERQYLERVQERIEEEQIAKIQEFKDIPHQYKGRYADVKWGDDDLVKNLQDMVTERLRQLENLSKNPYFGRIDFVDDNKSKEHKIYIGKTTVRENDGEILTTDWRAPICTLYYDQSLGKVSYQAPDGEISGDLKLKSQIIIEDGILKTVRDTDLVANDELLSPYLTTSADNRLKNIVASIQSEQNSIIRLPLRDDLIVQGVAGSGKTTVALHRDAYLIYNEEDYTANNFMIIGPNKYFLNYISALLPDIDTENVSQYTFDDFVHVYLEHKVKICGKNSQDDGKCKNFDELLKYKTSLEYKKALDNFLNDFVANTLEKGIYIDDYELFSAETIKQFFSDNSNLSEKATDATKILTKRVKANFEKLYDIISEEYRKEIKLLPMDDPKRKQLFDKTDQIQRELKGGCSTIIRNYFKPFKTTSLNLYKEFISQLDNYIEMPEIDVLNMQKYSSKVIKGKQVTFEECPALVYLEMFLNGSSNHEVDKYVHITIDEAQDYGLFHYAVLKKAFPKATFSIYGDLAQSIHNTRGVDSWEEVNEKIFDSQCDILTLDRSYRTTIEITNSANNILRHLQLKPAEPVIRTGEEVRLLEEDVFGKKGELPNTIYSYMEKDYKSMAVICRDNEEVKQVKGILQKENINASYISDEDTEYMGGLCVLTSDAVKGLEFDATILPDVSEQKYNSSNNNDMKLLYVAMTRALHEMTLATSGELTKPLQNEFTKEHKKKLTK